MGKVFGGILILLGFLVITSAYGVLGFEIPLLGGTIVTIVGIILIFIGVLNFRTRPRGY
ncbi:MAG: hypothetical protein AABW93_03050 [Nanoarchaeota archaeon]